MYKNVVTIIGLMSGTSLDGLDVAACVFSYSSKKWNYRILAAKTYSYSDQWIQRLQTLDKQDAQTFVQTDIEYGHLLGNFVNVFMKEFSIVSDYIASHGHTVFHQPKVGITSQIGSGAALAAETEIDVVCDFRTKDVALGGQGAPLVPIGDELLFSDFDYCLNIGGFSNISFDENGIRKAFDVSPANMALNYFARKENLSFDRDGQLAGQGRVQQNLFEALNAIDFYSGFSAKSLGKEWFEDVFLPIVSSFNYTNHDILATIIEHIAYQVGRAVNIAKDKKILITGGGAKNTFLTERIACHLSNMELVIPDELLIDYKEALIFAFLGCLRINGQINCLKTVTGGKRNHITGAVYLG